MHADGPRAVGPHGKPVEASASTTASDVGDIWKSVSKNLNTRRKMNEPIRRARSAQCAGQAHPACRTCC